MGVWGKTWLWPNTVTSTQIGAIFSSIIKYRALRRNVASKGPLKILREVLDVPSGAPKGHSKKGAVQRDWGVR